MTWGRNAPSLRQGLSGTAGDLGKKTVRNQVLRGIWVRIVIVIATP